jgi:hypothetical protein
MLPSLRPVFAAIALWLATAAQLHAQDALSTARELYASAEYESALQVLDAMSDRTPAGEDRQAIEVYRTLCLLAVGRRAEADRTIEAIFVRNPLYRPSEDLSPRTRTAFIDAKKRLFPTIVQQQYASAKTAFERKDFETAARTFRQVVQVLEDPEIAPTTLEPALSDLRTLAMGFYDLSVRASAPPAPAPPPAPVPAAPASPTVPATPRVYTADDAGVAQPVSIFQDLPKYPGVVAPGGFAGVIEVLISEKGTVESATLVVPIKARTPSPGKLVPVSSAYTETLMTAASRWLYRPAQVNGTPVKFRKRVQVNIQPIAP